MNSLIHHPDQSSVTNWIPVEESMPDDDETVLVYVPEHDSDDVWLGYHEDDKWLDPLGFEYQKAVTHWMALPEPPKKKEDAS